MNKIYDFLIIGSGISGLTIASILSKEGYKVAVLEKNKYVGGNLACFKRDNIVFDTGVHYTGGFAKGKMFDLLYRYLGIREQIHVQRQDIECFDRILLKDKQFDFAQGYERHIDKLIAYFPHQQNAIRDYYKAIQYYGSMDKLGKVFSSKINMSSLSINIIKETKKYISDQQLINILTATNPLYAGKKDKTPFVLHAHVMDSYINDSWKLIGGGEHLANALSKCIKSNGGDIFLSEGAQEILYQDKKAIGVIGESGQIFGSRNIISSLHPQAILRLIPKDKVRKSYRKRVNSIENTAGMFSLYMLMKKNVRPYMNYNLYYYGSEDTWLLDNYKQNTPPKGFFMFNQLNKAHQKYADGIVAMTYMSYDEVRKWSGLPIDKRGDAYLELKERKTEELLTLIDNAIPNFRSQIASVYSSTPLSYESYYNMPEGAVYGIMRDCNRVAENTVMSLTKTPNLFLTGQSISLHGLFGSTVGSVVLASYFIGYEYFMNKLNNA